jgi:glycosyltransferase involved in cell wall biosynthesis
LFKEKLIKKFTAVPAPARVQNTQLLISVVIVVYNMQRAALRTLRSFTAAYQGLSPDMYEVLVVENGSDQPLSKQQVESFGPNFRYFALQDAHPSPVGALNFGVKQAKGKMVGLMIDGAHLVTPGVLQYVLRAFKAYKNPVVAILALQLGEQMQRLAMKDGYSEQAEDALLQKIDWPTDGYKLFGISTLTGVNANGWFSPMLESNCVFLLRRTYHEMGGFDERFDAPGGGLANLDFYYRLCAHPSTELITLLGEGSFHQIHGGVSTNNTDETTFQPNLTQWKEQYKTIRGKDFQGNPRKSEYWGKLAPSATPLLQHSIKQLIDNKA